MGTQADRTGNLRDRIKTAVEIIVRNGTIEWDPTQSTRLVVDRFLCPSDVVPTPRRPPSDEVQRRIEHISEMEIASGVLFVSEAIHEGKAK